MRVDLLSFLSVLFFFSQCISSQSNTTYLSIGVYKNNNNIGKCVEDNFQFGVISLQNGYCVPSYLPLSEDSSPLHMFVDEYNHIKRCKTKFCGLCRLFVEVTTDLNSTYCDCRDYGYCYSAQVLNAENFPKDMNVIVQYNNDKCNATSTQVFYFPSSLPVPSLPPLSCSLFNFNSTFNNNYNHSDFGSLPSLFFYHSLPSVPVSPYNPWELLFGK